MANLEGTGHVQETYHHMNREEVQQQLDGDKFYKD